MQNTSSTWQGLFAAGAALEARADVVTAPGISTLFTGIVPVIRRAAMQGSLGIGNVVSASLSLVVRNAVTIPRSAKVTVQARLKDGQTASEWLPQGTFFISRRARDPVTGLLALECYDALLKANALWEPSAGTWPRTMAAVAAELAALLGLEIDSRTTLPEGAAFVISEPPAGTTVRDVLGVIAQAGGGNWIVTPENRLRLLPVGGGTDTVDVTGVTGGMRAGAAGTVTGVRCTVDGLQTLIGDDTGIVVDATVAPVIAADMAEGLIGQAYQPFSLTGAIYDPAAELGDAVRAGVNGEVASVLYSETAALGPAFRGDIEAPEAGEIADEYPYIGSGKKVLALAKAAVNEAVDRLDDDLTQQEIFDRLTDNGAAQGLVLYNGQLYINASYIQSGTLVLGGLNNQNGTLKVLNAAGQEIGTWTKDGISIRRGDINLDSTGSVKVGFNAADTKYVLFNVNGMQLMLDSGSIIKTDSMGFVNFPHYPDNTTFGMLNAAVEDGSEKWESKFVPGYFWVGHRNGGISDYRLEYDLETFRVIGPDGEFEVDTDNGWVYTTYGMSVIGNAVFNSVRADSLDLFYSLPIASGGTGAMTPAGARANLEITPANIGAAADSAAMQFRGWYPNGQSMLSLTPGYYQTSPNNLPSETFPSSINSYGTLCVNDTGYTHITYISVLGDFMSWASNSQKWYVVQHNGYVPVSSGGTGATTAAGARANLGVNDIGPFYAQSGITPVNDDQTHNITISADCWVCVSLHVTANINGGAIVWRNSIPVINNGNTNGACNYWANAQFPCKAGGLLQYRLNSNATDSFISFLTV